jgi:YVTN family beta-propeller protein
MSAPGRHVASGSRRPVRWFPVFSILLCLILVLATVAYLGGKRLGPGSGHPLLGRDEAQATDPAHDDADGQQDAQDDEQNAADALPTTSSRTRMTDPQRITGDITPKSVVASGHGLVIANNMMYSHNSTVYDASTRSLEATVDDGMDMSEFGFDQYPGTTQGAPVEAAWTDDGRYAYVSQYQLTGESHGESGNDDCRHGEGTDPGALFPLDTETMQWDQVIEVGRVPKYVAISPDGSFALVSNWCDRTVSVVDLEAGEVTDEIPVDSAPRGIVILPDDNTAYVAAMYADELFRIDVDAGTSELVRQTGRKPRHLVLSPDGTRMYMTEAGADRLLEMDARTGEVLRETATGREPRSMDISPDGTALYVVNYYENSVSKFDVDTFGEVQREQVGERPVGVTYEPATASVWVANYAGSLDVFDDSVPADEADGTSDGGGVSGGGASDSGGTSDGAASDNGGGTSSDSGD